MLSTNSESRFNGGIPLTSCNHTAHLRKSKKEIPAETTTSTLSAEKFPDAGTSTGDAATIKKDYNDLPISEAHVLIRALENFMLPIIHARAVAFDGVSSTLSPEAEGVLAALKKFIASLVEPQKTQHDSTKKIIDVPEKRLAEATKHLANPKISIASVPNVQGSATSEPRFLKAALEQAHHHVFNRMPIRLLTFKLDGSGIELIERSAIWDSISTSIQSNIEDLELSIGHVPRDMNTEKKAIEEFISNYTRYAILSHTWLHGTPGEVTYTDWKNGHYNKASPGYQKLANFSRVAALDHRCTLGWMDTICINKESSSELDESIRSMFKWYFDASVCVTYLAQTSILPHMHTDPWFTRGWTLQELLAPHYTKFYGKNWQIIADVLGNDTTNYLIQQEIQAATSITQDELNLFQLSRHHLPISRRMQWAANRRVTREEDIAYSLMGIFDVSISIAYGEGSARAFLRLVNEILASGKTDVLDIVNWCTGPDPELGMSSPNVHPSSLIPSSPKQYLWRAKEDIVWFPLATPITLTHVGLRLPVLLMPAIAANPNSSNTDFHPIGIYSAAVDIDAEDPINPGERLCRTYKLLDTKLQTMRMDWKTPTSSIMLFGVLNFGQTDTSIILPSPSPCLAVCLHSHTNSPVELVETSNVHKVQTSSVICFDLKGSPYNTSPEIDKDSLGRHGMMLYDLYL